MQEQMKQVRASKDSGERQHLMQQHMQSMHKMMNMMATMQHPGMQGDADSGEASQGSKAMPQCTGDRSQCEHIGRMEGRQHQMEQRMNMMQMMMEQMLEHEAAAEAVGE